MLDGIPIGDLSAPFLLGLAVLLVLTGRIVTRKVYEDKAAESEKWRLAYEKEREARAASEAQTSELLEVTKTTHAFITAIFYNSERIKQQSGAPDALTGS